MATVAKDANQRTWGHSVLLMADFGTVPTEELGYAREGIKLMHSRKTEVDYVQDVTGKIDVRTMEEELKISGVLAQFDADLLARVLGVTKDVGLLDGGGTPEELEVALRIISSKTGGAPFHLLVLKAKSSGALEMAFTKEKPSGVPFEFESLQSSNRLWRYIMSLARADLTIATGAVARINASPTKQIAWLRLAGESAAADILDDITGGGAVALADGEIVRIQIFSTAQPITINHASGVIELKDAVDWTMNKLNEWIDLYYDLTNTTWKELARYDLP